MPLPLVAVAAGLAIFMVGLQNTISTVGTAALSAVLPSSAPIATDGDRVASAGAPTPVGTTPLPSSSASFPPPLHAQYIVLVNGQPVQATPDIINAYLAQSASAVKPQEAVAAKTAWYSGSLDNMSSVWNVTISGKEIPTTDGVYTLPPSAMLCIILGMGVHTFLLYSLMHNAMNSPPCKRVSRRCRRSFCCGIGDDDDTESPTCMDDCATLVSTRCGIWFCVVLGLGLYLSGFMLCTYRAYANELSVGVRFAEWFVGLGGMGKSLMGYEWVRTTLFGASGTVILAVLKIMGVEFIKSLFNCNCDSCCRNARRLADRITRIRAAAPVPVPVTVTAPAPVPTLPAPVTPSSTADEEADEIRQLARMYQLSRARSLKADAERRARLDINRVD